MSTHLGKGSILKKTIEIGSSTLLSRFLGIFREMIMTWYFGASGTLDAFLTAYKIPNSLRKITEGVGVKMPAPAVNEQFISEKKQAPVVDEEKLSTEAPVAVQKKVAEKPKVVKGLSDGSYTIRIASFRKQETADRELQRVLDTLGATLHGVGRVVKKIESDFFC